MRDNQRQAVYRWETKLKAVFPELNTVMTLEDCGRMIYKVWSDYRPNEIPPRLKDGRGTTWARGGRWKINLPVWARCHVVVLHEIAHSILPYEVKHGREFASFYLDLLARYCKIDRKVARRLGITQKPRRVHFAPMAGCPKPKKKIYKFK